VFVTPPILIAGAAASPLEKVILEVLQTLVMI
jgi:hypothetical protein